jgi:hypothetical protein
MYKGRGANPEKRRLREQREALERTTVTVDRKSLKSSSSSGRRSRRVVFKDVEVTPVDPSPVKLLRELTPYPNRKRKTKRLSKIYKGLKNILGTRKK